jgi:hypothetical protein
MEPTPAPAVLDPRAEVQDCPAGGPPASAASTNAGCAGSVPTSLVRLAFSRRHLCGIAMVRKRFDPSGSDGGRAECSV